MDHDHANTAGVSGDGSDRTSGYASDAQTLVGSESTIDEISLYSNESELSLDPGSPRPIEPTLSEDAHTLINRLAHYIGNRVAEHMKALTESLLKTHSLPSPAPRLTPVELERHQKQQEEHLRRGLQENIGKHNLSRLHVRKTIYIVLGPVNPAVKHHDPYPSTTTWTEPNWISATYHDPTPDLRTVIPGKLLASTSSSPGKTVFEPTKEFTNIFLSATSTAIREAVASKDPEVLKMIARQVVLHNIKRGMPPGNDACPFQILEEDFEWARGPEGNKGIDFEVKCSSCGGRHAFVVE